MEIQCNKGFHLKPKAAINNTEISSLICKTILISMNTVFSIYLLSLVLQWNSLESNFSLMIWWTHWLLHGTEIMTNVETVPVGSYWIEKCPSYVKHTIVKNKQRHFQLWFHLTVRVCTTKRLFLEHVFIKISYCVFKIMILKMKKKLEVS